MFPMLVHDHFLGVPHATRTSRKAWVSRTGLGFLGALDSETLKNLISGCSYTVAVNYMM